MLSKGLKCVVLLLLLAVVLANTAGCWNRREIESLGFVLAAGLDEAAEEGKIQLTVHIAKPFAIGGGEGGRAATEERPFWSVSSTGYTVFEAVRNLLSQSPRRPFWGHNRFILIGEEFARRGLADALDVIARDGESRRRVWMIVAKGAKASDLLQVEFELERMPSEGGMGILEGARRGLSTVGEGMLNDFLQRLKGEGIEPIATRAEIVPRPQRFDIRGELERETMGGTARLTGAAVFKDDRLVGWLDKEETRGYNWIAGKVRSGVIVIENPREQGKFVGLEILGARSGFKLELKDGKVGVTVKVEAEANVADVQGFVDLLGTPEIWSSMERRMAAVIENEVLAAVARAQELGSDIFGFGAELNRRYPRKWSEEFRDRWDEEFRKVDVKVEVKAKLRRMGLTLQSLDIR
ncbi:MAG: Ger(x)C family spore germination protein [Firmicutes bacterium]|nr:Ger(x)C family spore germination protein [Bacillota bacterium]MDH7496770.1 Ger(x)C family spore germination protein [Bacillota bacterium]